MTVVAKNKVLILCQYPVVKGIRERIKDNLDVDSEFFVVSTEASAGYRGLLKILRARTFEKIYVLIADTTVAPLASILQFISLVVPASERYLLYPDGRIESFSISNALLAAGRVGVVSVLGFISILYMGLKASRLLRRARVIPIVDVETCDKTFGYLRTNLWLGVQAGGAITHTRGVVGAMLKLGWKVLYFSYDKPSLDVGNQVTHITIAPKHPYIIPREFNHFLYDTAFTSSVLKELKNFRGILYQRASLGNFSGVKISRKLRLPLVIEYNGSENWLSRNWGTPFIFKSIIESVEAATLQHAHLITTVSEPLREELIARGVSDDRIVVHPNGVDVDKFDPSRFSVEEIRSIRSQLGISDDAIVITFVGTFGPWHGAEVLADAARYFYEHKDEEFPDVPDLTFLFIGDGVRRMEVEERAKDLVASGKVILTGLVTPDEIPLHLVASDILATPTLRNPDGSVFFGSPTKLFEYMAAAKPIITSDLGQIADIFFDSPSIDDLKREGLSATECREGEFGVRVAPGSMRQLLDAIIIAAQNPEWCGSAGKMARKRVLERFTWDHQVTAVIDKLSSLLTLEKDKNQTRILVNALHSKSGGGLTYLKNVLPRIIADKALDVHVCLQRGQEQLLNPSLMDAKIHYIDQDNNLFKVLLAEQIYLPALAKQIEADVIFSPANYGPIFFHTSVILIRNALSVAFVERRIRKLLYWSLLYFATAISAFKARRVIFVSNYARNSISNGIKYRHKDNTAVVPHGVNFDLYSPGPMNERDTETMLLVSDIYVQKNIHNLLLAMEKIVKKRPGIKLNIAGDSLDAEYTRRIHRLVSDLKIGGNVNFLGSVKSSELSKLYKTCGLFVFPSTVETFGNPLVEAMASGCPIACSDRAAMPEVGGDAAMYFNPHNVEEIAEVIIGLLENDEQRRKLSEKAIKRAEQFSWDITAKRTINVLTEAANQ
ncbi:MAG: glycosyltransferase [Rhodospirillales bacterium]